LERWLLLAGMVVSWMWVILEIVHATRSLAEWQETIRVGLRSIYLAVTMALSQVMLIRLVIAWEEPEQPNDQKDLGLALEHTFARWRSLVALSVLDLLWPLLLNADGSPTGVSRWLLLEAMFLFVAVPVAVARVPGSSLTQGAAAMQMLWRALLPLIGITITAVVVLSLVRYASGLIMGLMRLDDWRTVVLIPVHALVLATVRNWVFLATVLTLLRHGFKPSTSGRTD
jgi:hypothetical protein